MVHQEQGPAAQARRLAPPSALQGTAPRVRLESIDALRALAAIAVVLVHMFEIFGLGLRDVGDGRGGLDDPQLYQIMITLYRWVFQLGAFAVPVFIVVSGYSLMIPIARSSTALTRAGQLRVFFYRRVRRIVPPYYAAMILSLLIIMVVPGMAEPAGRYWDRALGNLDGANILAHLLLVHNFSGSWIGAINPPFWSLAVEWQLYFLFPLMVLLWRRAGVVALLAVAAVYGISLRYLDVTLLPFSSTHFVLLFALGMAGAGVVFARDGLERLLRDRLPWGVLAALGLACFGAMHVGRLGFGLPFPDGWSLEILVAGAVTALMVHCTKSQLEECESAAERALRHPSLVRAGAFSYSLYLVHMPVLAMLAALAAGLALPATYAYLLVFAAGLPLSLAVAYGFHLVFERPFLNAPPAPRVSPAPA